jgi:parallel beta helix pectate lyase-like protein
VLAGVIAALALTAAPAGAAGATVNCVQLQSALSAAKTGDTVTLNELCKSGFPYTLPAVQMTLAGTPGAGFDGGSTVQLQGAVAASTTIEGLVFENVHSSSSNSGGALSINSSGSPTAVTLARDTFSGDVTSAGDGGGARINTGTAAVTVTNSTFTNNSATLDGGGLTIFATSATLSGDTFTGNAVTGTAAFGGGLDVFAIGGAITLSNSQFAGNTSDNAGGGATLAAESPGVAMTLSGNTFSHNSVSDPSGTSENVRGYLGGGLLLEGDMTEPVNVVQRGNTFDGNSVSFKAAPVSAWGGGESTTHIALQSTGDRFTNNTLQSPNAAENAEPKKVFGWGAGLSVAQCGDPTETPPTAPNVVSTLTDAIVAGNTLLSGPSANGAGVYVGFVCPNAYATLQVNDSTVAGNVVSGASGRVAGISGGPHDVLALANTIVSGDTGGPELGGFQSLAGVSATYSDICSGTAPFAGAGNICADPLLAGPGPGSADVRETAASPTLERGSNALIPAGVSSDALGGPRVLGPTLCGVSPAPVVDIGAAEYAYPLPSCPPLVLTSHPQPPVAPTLSSLGQTNKTWREGSALAQLSATHGKGKRKLPIGTTFTFKLDQAAQVTFTFTKPAPGRKVGKRCVAQTQKNKRKHRCKRTVTAGTMTFAAHTGANKVRFQGLISKRKKLKPGSYKLLVVATVAGKRSRTATLSFTIAP